MFDTIILLVFLILVIVIAYLLLRSMSGKKAGGGGDREIEYQFTFESPEDVEEMKKRLHELGATKRIEALMPITVYNPANQNDQDPTYVRVRHEGKCITFTVKKDLKSEFPLEYEVELEPTPHNLEQINKIVLGLGATVKYRVDKIRETWDYDGVKEIVFDTYPGLPTYMEIDAHDEETLHAVVKKLGLKVENRSTSKDMYNTYFGIPKDRKFIPGSVLTFDESAKDLFKGMFEKNEEMFDENIKKQKEYVKKFKI